MKRLLALMLTVCLLAAPVSAGAQEKITTEELIVGVLELIVSGLQSGRLDMTYAESGSEYGLVLGEDATGMPGGMLSITEGGQTQLFGADGQGVFMSAGAWKEGDSLTGMSWESILRAVCTDENGVCWLPSFTEEDSQMLAGVGLQLVLSMADTVKVTESGSTIVIDVELGAFLDALDAAVPAALRAAAPQLDDFLARNNVVTYLLFDVEAPLTTETLIEIWSNLNIGDFVQGEMPLRLSITTDDETGDWNAVLAVADEGTITAQSKSGRIVATLTAEGETMVLFDTADLETVMDVVAEALYFIPQEAFDFQTAYYGYVHVSLDVKKLLRSFLINLSASVLANSEKVDALIERYFWLFDELFGGTVVNGFTLASWLQFEGARYAELDLPKVFFELDLGAQPRLVMEVGDITMYFTGMGSQFSGMVQLRNYPSSRRVTRYDISGFATADSVEALITYNGVIYNNQPDAYRFVGTRVDGQSFECALSARVNNRWTDLFILRATASVNGVYAVLTDSQNTKMAELQADDSGFMFRMNGYQTPSELRKLGMPQMDVDGFETEVRITENGGRIRIGGTEVYTLEWTYSGVTKHIALTCSEFTVNVDMYGIYYAHSGYVGEYDIRYNDAYGERELTLFFTPYHISVRGRSENLWYARKSQRVSEMSLDIDLNDRTLRFNSEMDRESTTITYRPGAFVYQQTNTYLGIAETFEIVDVSEHYDNLNTTRIRFTPRRGIVAEALVVTNAPDAHTAVIDLISEGKTFSTLTVTNRPAVREAMPVRWLTEAETRAVLSLVLYALEDEPESTEEPAG